MVLYNTNNILYRFATLLGYMFYKDVFKSLCAVLYVTPLVLPLIELRTCSKVTIRSMVCARPPDKGNTIAPEDYPLSSAQCSPGRFQCSDNSCILDALLCDGKFDCPDNSDENFCHNVSFSCHPHQCSDIIYLCNKRSLANNWSDHCGTTWHGHQALSDDKLNCSTVTNGDHELVNDLFPDCKMAMDEFEVKELAETLSSSAWKRAKMKGCLDPSYVPCWLDVHSSCYHPSKNCQYEKDAHGN